MLSEEWHDYATRTVGIMRGYRPRPRAPQGTHWAGNRYTWWQLLAVVGWMRGLVEFPEIGAWRCPSL